MTMKLEIAGSTVNLDDSHLWFVIGVTFAILAALVVIAGVVATAMGDASLIGITHASMLIAPLIGIIAAPLGAWIYLWAMPYFKISKDDAGCKAVAAAQFILYALLFTALPGLALLMGVPTSMLAQLFSVLSGIAGFATGAVITYLWMLIFIKKDVRAVKRSALPALIAGILIVAFSVIATYGAAEYLGYGDIPALGLKQVISIATFCVVALPLVHFMPKKLNDPAYLFAGLFIFSAICDSLAAFFLSSIVGGGMAILLNTVNAFAVIAVLYLVGTYDKKH